MALELARVKTLRRDAWWAEPLPTVLLLGTFIVYATWAAFANVDYYAAPYLSPFYSPCLAANCAHGGIRIVGSWWSVSPALLILWAPLGFRTTCYYYRKAYYRAFMGSPPACAVQDVPRRYSGETKFPFVLQNLHRYFFWAALGFIFFLWWDVSEALRFPTVAGDPHSGREFGMGMGTLVLFASTALLTLYSLSCHSCRHLVGGHLDVFSKRKVRHRLWRIVSTLNQRHPQIAWASLVAVGFADVYVRLLSNDVIRDLRFF